MRIPGIPSIPAGWVEKVIFILWLGPKRAWGYNERMWFPSRRIEYYPRAWIFLPLLVVLVWPWVTLLALEHGVILPALPWPAWLALVVILAALYVLAWYMVVKHARGHANGVPASGCVGRHLWCVMAEEPMVGHRDGSWQGKVKLLVHQVKGLGRYCGECKKVVYATRGT